MEHWTWTRPDECVSLWAWFYYSWSTGRRFLGFEYDMKGIIKADLNERDKELAWDIGSEERA